MRTVDPDQEQPYYGNFATRNYVKFQPLAADGSDSGLSTSYVNPSNPDTALVVAVGKNNYDFFCGLGTINPNARVSHYGFWEFSPPYAFGDAAGSRQWTNYGGSDMLPTSDYVSRMYKADEAIHLVFKYPSISPGETVQFSYAYVLKAADLDQAMAGIATVTVTQPTSDMTGRFVTVAARVSNATASAVSFYIYAKKGSAASTWYLIDTDTAYKSTYSVTLDTTVYVDGNVQLMAQATCTTGTFLAYKASVISNVGVVMTYVQNDLGGTYPFSVASPTVLNMTVSDISMGEPDSISWYREIFKSGEVVSVLLSTRTSKPWQVSVSVSDLAVGTVVGVKAAVKSGYGAYQTSTVFGGVVSFVNTAPSDISLSSKSVKENTANGILVGTLSTTDVDSGQSHTYTLVDSAGGRFAIAGTSLIVNGAIDYEATTTLNIRIRTSDGQSSSCCFEKDFTITVINVNEAPTSISPTTASIYENTAVGTVVLTLSTTDPDWGQTFSYSLLAASSYFSLSPSGVVTVKGTVDYETVPEVVLYVRSTDSGSPNMYLDSILTITVYNVNEAPSSLSVSCNPCVVLENTAIDTVIGTLSSTDQDVGDSFTYKSLASNPAAEVFAVSSAGVISVQKSVDYESTGGQVTMYLQTKDAGGLTFARMFTFVIQDLPEPPSADSIECYCDEDRRVGDIALSLTELSPAFCQVSASTSDNSELSYTIISNQSATGNFQGAFDIQSCSGVIMVNQSIDFEVYNRYAFTVQIESLGGIVYADVVIHIVNVNEAPVFSSTTYAVNENSAVGTVIAASLEHLVSDPDNADPLSAALFCCDLTFHIESGNSAGMFSLADVNTGELTVAKTGLNYEATSSYVLGVSVTDAGGLIAGAEITITLIDINEAPAIVKATGTYASIPENSVIGTQTGFGLYATDEDISQTITLEITGGNTGNVFSLTSVLSAGTRYYYFTVATASINFEVLNSYTLVVNATDNGTPPMSDSGHYIITVTDVNESPTISSTATFNINENSPKGTLVGAALRTLYSDPDVGSTATFSITSYGSDKTSTFGINSTSGQLSLSLTYLNYEVTPLFTYVVRVTDNGGLFASCTVTINVNDVQEPPKFGSLLAGKVAENAPLRSYVGGNGQALEYTGSDDDGDLLNFTVVSVNGDAGQANFFEVIPVSSTSMSLRTQVVFDYEVLKQYSVVLGLTDHHSTVEATVLVNIENANDAPTIDANMDCYVPENALAGASICSIVGADVDAVGTSWGTLTYALVNPISGLTVSSAANVGTLSLSSSVDSIGWSPGDVITNILVRVTDGGALSAQTNVTLTVNDVNFPPACPTTPLSFAVNENTVANTVLGTLTGTDPNTKITDDSVGVTLLCSVTSGNSAGKFVLGSDCVLKTSSSPTNYEQVTSYSLTVRVTENTTAPLSSSCPVTITILDVNEPTTLNDQSFNADENIASGKLKSNGINAPAVKVIDEDPADQYGIFSLVCISCKDNPISINATTGFLSLKAGYMLNFETFPTYTYTVNWSSRGVSKSATITINLMNIFEPPIAYSSTITVAENVVSADIGYVQVIDPDFEGIVDFAGGAWCTDDCGLKYTLVSSTSGSLSVDANTGAIRISALGIDFENAASHTMDISARDTSGLTATCRVTIVITDVADCAVTSITNVGGSAVSTASTSGGLQVYITGRNFGPTRNRMSTSAIPSSSVTITAKLQSGPDAAIASYVFTLARCAVLRTSVHDNTLVNCSVPEGVGKNLGVVLTVSANYGGTEGVKTCTTTLSTSTLSYSAPAITDIINGYNMSTAGGNTVTIQGSNFGAAGKSYNVISGQQKNSYLTSEASCVVSTSHSAITCVSAEGYGKSVDWRVTVGGQASVYTTGKSSFHHPVISSVTAADLDTAGGGSIQINGANFAEDISKVKVTYGDDSGKEYTASCTYTATHTDLSCVAMPGIGKNLRFFVTVADQASTVFQSTVQYKIPVLDYVTGSGTVSGTTEGGDIIYLTGTQFGPTSVSYTDIIVQYGKTGTEFTAQDCRIISASTKVQCVTAQGTGVDHKFRIGIADQWSNLLFTNASYAPPTISSFSGVGAQGGSTKGNELVYVSGRNFGATYDTIEMVYYSEFNGTIFDVTDNCTMSTPHRVLSCYTATGAGSRLSWSVIVDSQLSVSPMTSYGPPVISSLSGDGVVNASVNGDELVIITGQNFGPPNAMTLYGRHFLEGVTYGKSGSEYRAANCVVNSNTEIACKTVAGVGGNMFWQLTIAGQQSDLSTQTTSYAPPRITQLSPAVASTNGKTLLTIYGTSLAVDTLPLVFFGTKRVSAFSNAEDSLSFFVPEANTVVSSQYGVYVNVGGQLSNVVMFSYQKPTISTINSVDSGNNSVILSILGQSFSRQPIVQIIPYDAPNDPVTPYCYRKKHEEIICDITVRAGNVTVSTPVATSKSIYYEFGEPVILSTEVIGGTRDTTGYTTANPAQIEIIGQNFGGSMNEYTIQIENADDGSEWTCVSSNFQYISKTSNPSEWSSTESKVKSTNYDSDLDFQIATCQIPEGQGKSNSLKVQKGFAYSLGCGCELCTTASCFSYNPPVVQALSPSSGSTNGLYTILLKGSNFGLSPTVTIGGQNWVVNAGISNHTHVYVTVPAGEGTRKLAMVQVGNQNNTASPKKYWSYQAPVVDAYISTLQIGTGGSTSPITVTGSNFGLNGPVVTLGTLKITLDSFTHNSLTFSIPPGVGKNLALTVNVSNQIGVSPDVFAYIPPSISTAFPLNCDTAGGRDTGVMMTLMGANFGYRDKDWTLKIGSYSVVDSDIVSYNQTHIVFYPPAGQGTNLLLQLTVGSQMHTGGPYQFSYNPPKILSMQTPADKNTAGGYLITFTGESFGTSGLTITIQDPLYSSASLSTMADWERRALAASSMRMGPTACVVSSQTHTEAKCKVPAGVGQNLMVTFDVNGQTTYTDFSYSPPVVDFFYQSNGGDASGGESLKLFGRNFGAFRTNVNISIGKTLCKKAVWLADDPVYDYAPYLKCETRSARVGTLNVTVYVGYQVSKPNGRYSVQCKAGAFGGPGEYCTSCGVPEVTGFVCEKDNMYSPVAYNGWYLSYMRMGSGDCPPNTAGRDSCPVVQPCMPSNSCEGNNTCAVEYTGVRCATCAEGYYRINGRCQECPTSPWAIVLAAVLVVLCGGYIGYKLQQKNVNLGIMSIGIDYFQVLAVFGSADVSWPPSLVNMYNSFSIFNFNIDVAAPECYDAVSLSYKQKWIGVTLSPIIVLVLIWLFYVGFIFYAKLCRPDRVKHTEVLYKCIAAYLMVFYYGYLMLSNNTLAVFNCQPTDPPDGYLYMAEVGADGGKCYRPGTMQQELEPWAIIAFIVYTIGFPAFVAFILHTNSDKCVYAQVMRAAGRADNPDFEKAQLTRFKTLYNRLFYQFKPDYYYWVFCILVRKFCLSVAAVVFRENTVFLLALYLLILFTSYTAQVNYKPYMSTSEYKEVAEQYEEILSMHNREDKALKRSAKVHVNRLGSVGPLFELSAPEMEFFNNYNTVESYLLFSAIVVAICKYFECYIIHVIHILLLCTVATHI